MTGEGGLIVWLTPLRPEITEYEKHRAAEGCNAPMRRDEHPGTESERFKTRCAPDWKGCQTTDRHEAHTD